MKYILFFIAITFSAVSFGQTGKPTVDDPVVEDAPMVKEAPIAGQSAIFKVVEQMPQFPGGEEALMKFIQKNIQYPTMERDNDIQGRVLLKFIVNEDGSLSDVKVIRAVSPGIDKEALRVVKLMPKFKPGMQQGKVVRVEFVLPIMFKLAEEPVKKK